MEWTKALETWLRTVKRTNSNTARAYKRAIDDLLAASGGISVEGLADVGGAIVAGWANDMAERGLARATIAARLSAVSAFYRFCMTTYTDGNGKPLASFNPVDQVKRPEVAKYGNSRSLTVEQIGDLVAQIDTDTVQGLRDKAMILMAIYTGRRSSEIREIPIGHIQHTANGTVRYCWVMKKRRGKTTRWDDLPMPVWQAIQLYWDVADRDRGRLNDPVFTSHNGHVGPLTPLSAETFNQTVQRYARLANLPRWVTPHTLRHSACNLRIQTGESVLAISQLLGHSSLRTTQVYIEALTGFNDNGWQGVQQLLDGTPQVSVQ